MISKKDTVIAAFFFSLGLIASGAAAPMVSSPIGDGKECFVHGDDTLLCMGEGDISPRYELTQVQGRWEITSQR